MFHIPLGSQYGAEDGGRRAVVGTLAAWIEFRICMSEIMKIPQKSQNIGASLPLIMRVSKEAPHTWVSVSFLQKGTNLFPSAELIYGLSHLEKLEENHCFKSATSCWDMITGEKKTCPSDELPGKLTQAGPLRNGDGL